MPDITNLMDDKSSEVNTSDTIREDLVEPLPEPHEAASDLLKTLAAMRDSDDGDDLVHDNVRAMMEACSRLVRETSTDAGAQDVSGDQPVIAEVEEFVVAVEEEEPSWIEKKLGPWAARHRNALRGWLLALLILYVSLFASMLVQDGVKGLSERSTTAIVRDVLWAVLMGIIVLLALGKQYY